MNPLRLVPLGARLAAAFAILAAALLIVGLVGVSASRSLDLSSTSSSQGQRQQALALVSALGLNAQATAHEVVRHLYVYDGDLQNEDVIAWRVGQRKAQMLGELRHIRPQVADPRAVKALDRLVADTNAYARAADKAVALSRAETVRHAGGDQRRSASRTAYVDQATPALARLEATRSALARELEAENRAALAATSAKASSGQRTIWIVIAVALALSAVMAFVITRSITRPVAVLVERLRGVTDTCLSELGRGLEATARGDLTVSVEQATEKIGARARDEIGAASAVVDDLTDGARASIAAYETTRVNLGAMIGQVTLSARGVSAASEQVATNSEETGRAMAEISRAVGSVAGGAERQVLMVASASDTAEQMATAVG
ncbi:MAG: hypothetical protein ACXWZZ_06540, partial [Solirubrobacteraceae bacterium]